MEEIFDVVDEADRVVGQAPRSVVHRERWLHRAAHVFVFDSAGRLALQLRSAAKDEYPLCFTSSASGHLGSGEGYEEAAVRELGEELGLDAGLSPIALEFLVKLPASPETAYEHTALFRLGSDEPLRPDPEEIAELVCLPLREVAEWMDREPAKFSPPFRELFRWYVRNCPP
jgi:isopentenyl-diphosphate delta-isomerase type 1